MKIPNILTIGRIIIVPIFVLTFFIPGFFGDLIPFFIFILASFTDYLDGLLARLFKEESKLGELLDPIADKILVAAALILLVMNGTILKAGAMIVIGLTDTLHHKKPQYGIKAKHGNNKTLGVTPWFGVNQKTGITMILGHNHKDTILLAKTYIQV